MSELKNENLNENYDEITSENNPETIEEVASESASEGLVKSKKPKRMFYQKLAKGVTAGLVIASLVVGGWFIFAGFKNNEKPTPEVPPVVNPVNPEKPDIPEIPPEVPDNPDTPIVPEPPIIVVDPTTMEKFLSDYLQEAKQFANNVFANINRDGQEVLNYAFELNDDGFITAVKSNVLVKEENNLRTIAEEKYTFTNPVSVDNALEGIANTAGQYENKTIFTFDAKQNYCHQDLGNALFAVANLTDGQNFYHEIESDRLDKQCFEVIHISTQTNATQTYVVTVDKAETKEELISNLADSQKTTISPKATTNMGEYQIEIKDYASETFQPESVIDLIENFSDSLHTALNENFYHKILRQFYGRFYDDSNLFDTEWRIIHEDNKITGFQFFTKETVSVNDVQFLMASVTLAEPINVTDFTNEDAGEFIANISNNATIKAEMSYAYAPAKQENMQNLMNAIFEATGHGLEAGDDVERYIIDFGAGIIDGLGEIREFRVLQKDGDKIVNTIILIEKSSNYEEYAEKLKNSENYIIYQEKVFEINGEKLPYKDLSKENTLEDEEEMEL